MAYGAVFLLLAARPLASVLRPVPAAVAAVAAPIFVILFLPVFAGGTLLLAAVKPRRDWPGLVLEDRS